MKTFDETLIRLFDFFASLLTLIILSPLFLIAALWIKMDSPGPMFFKQTRLGRRGKHYIIYKFRTMVDGAESLGMKLLTAPDDSRITTPGRLMRASSIDELPQLINILRGEMSAVGPRPGLPEHLEKYTERQKMRLLVKPGLTGWAQIHGRNTISWPQRIERDIWYVENKSFLLNLGIIIRTIPVLFKKEFIYGAPANFKFRSTEVKEAVPMTAAEESSGKHLRPEPVSASSINKQPQPQIGLAVSTPHSPGQEEAVASGKKRPEREKIPLDA